MKKVAIIGHFGGNLDLTDGQTVKTKTLFEELASAPDAKIIKVDTYYKQKNPLLLLMQLIRALITCRKIILLVSGNGMKVFFPILYVASVAFHKHVYHDVIGGNLDQYLIDNPQYVKYLNSFQKNWVETKLLKRKVEACGIANCEVIPNFKRLNVIDNKRIKKDFNKPFEFCTFSRVMEEKGIEEAINAIQAINQEAGKIICTLDIYGLIDSEYKNTFERILKTSSSAIRYKGIVDYRMSVEAIKNYYALLFPTKWKGEGFPGTIVDSFSAGLPVIASNWNSNNEIIETHENGLIYPDGMFDSLKTCIKWIMDNPDKRYQMACNCVNYANKYQPDTYISLIKREMCI